MLLMPADQGAPFGVRPIIIAEHISCHCVMRGVEMLAIKRVVTAKQGLDVILEYFIKVKLVRQREGVVEVFDNRVR